MQHDPIDKALSRLYDTEGPSAGFDTGWRAAVRREESLQMNHRSNRFHISWGRVIPVLTALVLVMGSLWASTLDEEISGGTVTANRTLMSAKMAESYDTDAVVEDGGVSYSLSSASGISTYGATQMAEETPRKLVRTADLTLNTTAFDESLSTVRGLVNEMGGYVENLYQYGESVRRISLGLRIPSEKLDAFLSGLEGVGRVTSRSESTTDMTTQYADNQARLQTLYAKRDRLNELFSQATEISDLIEIESAIADTQYQIDSYETTQRSIDKKVDMSQVSLTLVEEKPADTATADVSLGERLSAALDASIEWAGEFLRDMLVFVVMALPVAVPVAVIGVVIWIIRRKMKKEK